jgi:hypothetical protein
MKPSDLRQMLLQHFMGLLMGHAAGQDGSQEK